MGKREGVDIKGDFISLTQGVQGHTVSMQSKSQNKKAHFADFQLNCFPPGYTALNELPDKGT